MLRDVGVRTKLLAVLAIPTVLLVVVTALLVAGQVSAARRAGQVNALTDVAIQVNRVVHSLQEERSATLGYLQATDAVVEGADGRPAAVHQQAADRACARWWRTRTSTQMSEAVRTAVARSAAAHEELRVGPGRPSTPAGSSPPRPTSSTPRPSAPTSTSPASSPPPAPPSSAQRLQAYEALSSSIEYASHERDLVEAGPACAAP